MNTSLFSSASARILRATFLSTLLCFFMASCTTTKPNVPANAIVITGKMNAVSGGKVLGNNSTTCWAMESGKDIRALQYYQFIGSEDLLKQIYEEDAIVSLRVVPRPDVKTDCPVGTVVEVFEVVSMKSKKD